MYVPHITESEWTIMQKLWEKSPITASEIVSLVQQEKKLVQTTVKTLLRRLIAKNAVGFTIDEHNQKLYYYFPLVSEEDCIKDKSEHFLSLYYKDDAKKLFTAFVDNAELSSEEIEELSQMLEKRKKRDAGSNQ
ncbi:BlaI/MecI/CopY family transcriptional regulator [Clostridiaceae bacterium OttesenSCG-928-D20]|nr:BlaI/MecI/CopY family transcriptional regulator [Clostridiaceae bacterium OttesenSCG-928-D20]